MIKCGVTSVSFRNYSPEIIIDEVSKCKLEYIEWGSDIHAKCNDTENILKIKELCDAKDIKCSSYGTYFRIGVNQTQEIYEYISAAKKLGTSILRLWCGNKNSEEYSQDEKQLLFSQCKKLSQIAEEENVILCLECHGASFTNSLDGALELMQAVNSENFKMYWQPHTNLTLEQNLQYAENIARYTKVVHVFNWTKDGRFPLEDAKGLWKKYLSYFNDVFAILEFMPNDTIEELENESKTLKEILL